MVPDTLAERDKEMVSGESPFQGSDHEIFEKPKEIYRYITKIFK